MSYWGKPHLFWLHTVKLHCNIQVLCAVGSVSIELSPVRRVLYAYCSFWLWGVGVKGKMSG